MRKATLQSPVTNFVKRMSKRRKTKPRLNRFGQALETLENRRLMFGDAIVAGVHLNGIVDAPNCIDYEDLPAAASYSVGDSFLAESTGLQATHVAQPYTWSDGRTFVGGSASVDNSNLAGHLGQDLAVNNILLDFDFGGSVRGIHLNFGEYGGNLNLRINGDFQNFQDFHTIDGTTIGGNLVEVPTGGFGNDTGELVVRGIVDDFAIGGQELWIDHVCADPVPVDEPMDWGDAPDQPYPTLSINSGARHRINPDVFLGNRVDPEPDGQPTGMAHGDDMAVSDDEDGVTLLTPLVPGGTAEAEVVASTDGWLNAWIDFDQSGSWDAGPEQVAVSQPLVAGSNIVTFTVPADSAISERVFSRWRFSTTHNALRPYHSPDIRVPDGEVEDYRVEIEKPQEERWDWGDAPDQPYPTFAVNDGARHRINPDVFLGKRIDPENNGQPTFSASGDDSAVTDDEDGVTMLTTIVPNTVARAEVVASVDGRLDAWVDFNQNGVWEPFEQVAVSEPMVAGTNTIKFAVPSDAVPHPLRPVYSRYRFSLTGGLAPRGPAREGEVEDYAVLNGDLNGDWTIDATDIDLLCDRLHAGDSSGDLNNDGVLDEADQDYLVREILGTDSGDANLDGIFNSADLIEIFMAGEYEDGIADNSTWASGDFNCDGEFTSGDLVKALQTGTYTSAAIAGPQGLAGQALTYFSRATDETTDDESGDAAQRESAATDPLHARALQRRLAMIQAIDSVFQLPETARA